MSESADTLMEIARHTKGRILLVGRTIGQEKFGVLTERYSEDRGKAQQISDWKESDTVGKQIADKVQ